MIDLAPLFLVFDSNTGKYQYFRCQKGELVVSLTMAVAAKHTFVGYGLAIPRRDSSA